MKFVPSFRSNRTFGRALLYAALLCDDASQRHIPKRVAGGDFSVAVGIHVYKMPLATRKRKDFDGAEDINRTIDLNLLCNNNFIVMYKSTAVYVLRAEPTGEAIIGQLGWNSAPSYRAAL